MTRTIERINALYDKKTPYDADDREVLEDFLDAVERGEVRAAEPRDGRWFSNDWVKKGILVGFRMGRVIDYSPDSGGFRFFDKDTYPLRRLEPDAGVRVVPGGSAIRRGTHIGRGVTCMPPMYINVGAYVGDGTMIDSHALVGSCAQIGRRVHLSAGAQIGGVLEPVGALPVIVEDDVLVGGNCGVYEGTIIERGAVLAAGVILTRGIPIYDLKSECVIRAAADEPLRVPAGAVVVAGARSVAGGFAAEHGLASYCALIVKYRDEKTDRSVLLEDSLR